MILTSLLTCSLALAVPAQGCQPAEFDLIGAQNFRIGDVTISNSTDTLRVDLEIAHHHKQHHDGRIYAVHVYAGMNPPPPNSGGSYAPGQFPYETEYYPNYVTSHTELIPFADLGAVCGDTVYWAVHADVWCDIHGEETAWAQGQTPFGGGQWGWYGDYDLCCGSTSGLSGSLDLSAGAMSPGAPVTFQVSGAQAGEHVRFYRTRGLIVMGGGATHPALGATVMDLQDPLIGIGSATADAAGVASLTVSVPASISAGVVVPVQAVVLRSPDAATSNPAYCVVD